MDTLENNLDKLREINSNLEQTLYGTNTGGRSYYDFFWDTFQKDGKLTIYPYAYYGSLWNDSIYEPKYDYKNISNGYCMFNLTGITDTKKEIILGNSASVLTSSMFASSKLITIRKITVFENNVFSSSMFSGSSNLMNITFEGTIANNISFSACSKLSKASQLNIFNTLSDTVADKTLTLSKSAVDNAFETAEGLADGSTSPEWLALVATKPNWTISLYE